MDIETKKEFDKVTKKLAKMYKEFAKILKKLPRIDEELSQIRKDYNQKLSNNDLKFGDTLALMREMNREWKIKLKEKNKNHDNALSIMRNMLDEIKMEGNAMKDNAEKKDAQMLDEIRLERSSMKDSMLDEIRLEINVMKDSILDEIRLERNVMAAKAEKKDREMIRKFDNALAWMDAVAQEVRDSRDERELAGQQTVRISNRVANHEKRIVVIEKKVA